MPEPARAEETLKTYPVRAVVRLTGLSPALLRAWERRYRAVEPLRTPGGTRRYRAEDVQRLRLLKKAVEAGGRISQLAKLASDDLEQITTEAAGNSAVELDPLIDAISRLDLTQTQVRLSQLFAAVGPRRFASDVAAPLLREVGTRWERGILSIASEHLLTSALRSMLGSVFQHTGSTRAGLSILFATPPSERHELGLLMAALTAASAGAHTTYLGPDLPVDEIVSATDQTRSHILALSIVSLDLTEAQALLGSLRTRIARHVRIWVGGARAEPIALEGVAYLPSLEALESRIGLLLASEVATP